MVDIWDAKIRRMMRMHGSVAQAPMLGIRALLPVEINYL